MSRRSLLNKKQVLEIEEMVRAGYSNADIKDYASEWGVSRIQMSTIIHRARKAIGAENKVDTEKPTPPTTVKRLIDETVKPQEPNDERLKRLAKTQITAVVKKKEEVSFPLVAKYVKNHTNQIVLFTSLHRGVVLAPADSALYAGYVNESFAACTDRDYWEILEEVTITFKS